MADPPMPPIVRWPLALLLAVLYLALAIGAQLATSYAMAYVAAPRDLAAFLDAIGDDDDDDGDAAMVADKRRLGRRWREIRRERDDLRRHLDRLLRTRADGPAVLKPGARLLWAGHRASLEERVRRLDRRRMRFCLDACSLGAAPATAAADAREKAPEKITAAAALWGEGGASSAEDEGARPAGLPAGLAEAIRKPAALRRSTTTPAAAGGPGENTTPPPSPHRAGWVGVVQELRASPRMHKRHASVEQSMRSPPRRFGRAPTHSPERQPP